MWNWPNHPKFVTLVCTATVTVMNSRPSALTCFQLTVNLHLTCLAGGSAHTSCPATIMTICIKVILPDCFGDLTLPMEIM